MKIKTYLCFTIFLVSLIPGTFSIVMGQETLLKGKVSDTTGTYLSESSILAFPETENEKTRFAISNQDGAYVLKLSKGISYSIEVHYLGYQKLTFQYTAAQDEVKDLILKPSINALDEVILNYQVPITVTQDTTTYNTDAFVNGEERKLREVLKKLPGIEVDREGNVTSQGKEVTKVLVEDKIFFTGNSKLAVNNIPADVVDKIQVIEDYNKVGFLKGLLDSDDIALNIKLKEDKKKFAFGDIEVGGGDEERYLAHSNLFYYGPKTNINFITDLNDIGIKSFTLKDYIDFNGGFGKLMGDLKGYLALSNDDLSQFLINTDFKENINRFGAFNLRNSLSPKAEMNAFVIVNHSDTETEVNTLNIYNDPQEQFNEERININQLSNFFILGKVTFDYEPNLNEAISANTFVKITNNDNTGNISTQRPDVNSTFSTVSDLEALEFRQNLEYSKRFSKKQTLSLESTFNHQNNSPSTNWVTDEAFLEGLIPLQEDNFFDVRQTKNAKSTSFELLLKDYWVLNRFNHIYTTFGTSLLFEEYTTEEFQILEDGAINDFSLNGFGNELDFRLRDTFLGLEYKFLMGKLTLKSGLFYHNYTWENIQENSTERNTTNIALPRIDATLEINSSEKIRFNYQQQVRFPMGNRFFNNALLSSFNTVLLGNRELANERFHTYSLNYYKFKLLRGFNLNAGINYTRKTQTIKNTIRLEEIEQFITYTMFNRPENGITANFDISKKVNRIKFRVNGSTSYNEFFQLVNDDVSKNISKSLSVTGRTITTFEKLPNLEVGYTYEPTNFRTGVSSNEFNNTEFFTDLSYDFINDFQLKGDFRRINYENITQNVSNSFEISNISLFYQKEDSPWGVEFSVTNIFDTKFKRQNSFSDFLVSDKTTFIVPRIVMLKMSYKF
nr:carboxypeptidase-like regulatory domain-containing protein [uncultured Allomuricauda sp.]